MRWRAGLLIMGLGATLAGCARSPYALLPAEQERRMLAERLGVPPSSLRFYRRDPWFRGERMWTVGTPRLMIETFNSVPYSIDPRERESSWLEPAPLSQENLEITPPADPRQRLAVELAVAALQRFWPLQPTDRVTLTQVRDVRNDVIRDGADYAVGLAVRSEDWRTPKRVGVRVNTRDRTLRGVVAAKVYPPGSRPVESASSGR